MVKQTISHYRVIEKLGEGGMGVVYKAQDTHLDRPVALKLLPSRSVADPERKRRFLQEAKAASALTHPNIIHIYSIDSADGVDFMAMEYVSGKTLGQLIGRKELSLQEVLKYSIQISDALAAAHSAGIVHRDVKPANIMVTDRGIVKVLDFGLAKLAERADGGPLGETVTADGRPQTEEGSILGTVAYMSPEQAEGKKVDARSDIFSFGSVLYEMATGRRAFEGPSKISTLSAILHNEPQAASEISPGVPLELEKIITRCLRKDPERRAQHMGDVKLALEELKEDSEAGKLSASVPDPGIVGPRTRSPFRLAAIACGAIALLAAAGLALQHWRKPPAPTRSEWLQITNLPDSVTQPALSTDGRMLTFIRGPSSFITPGQVYVKMLPSGEPVQLTHDERLKLSPVFSPDGSRIAYSVVDRIWDTWVVPVLGGQPRVWLPNTSGLVWIDKSKLLFSEIKDNALHMAIVTSEESRAGSRDLYVPPHERAMAHRSYPSPDRKSMLIVEMNETGAFMPCRLLPLDGSSPGHQVGPLGAACTFAAWSPKGDWMYFSSNAGGASHTWRQRFPDGEPKQITSGPTEEEGIAMAPDGRSFITAVGARQSSVWLHDSRGERQISLEGRALEPKFTPDGKRLCYRVGTGAASELWIAELESGRSEALLPGIALAGNNRTYDISADGRRLVLASLDQAGKARLWLAPLDRRAPLQQIPNVEGEQPVFAGEEIFFRSVQGTSAFLYRVREGGSDLRKASDLPVIDVFGVSVDRRKLVLGSARDGGWVIFDIDGGAPLHVPSPPSNVEWSGDGKYLFVQGRSRGKTYVLPLSPGHRLPESFARRFPSDAEIAKLPGVRVIPAEDVAAGPTRDVYAFTRETVQRNLYRIPVP